MAELKLKKIKWTRRRFIQSEVLTDLSDWSDVFEELKHTILTETAFQLIGQKSIIEIDPAGAGRVLVEVVGVPRAGFPSVDVEARDVLVYDYPESAYNVDFLTLKQEAKGIMKGISGQIDSSYHIVFEGAHLALHFFI